MTDSFLPSLSWPKTLIRPRISPSRQDNTFGSASKESISDGFRPFQNCCARAVAVKGSVSCCLTDPFAQMPIHISSPVASNRPRHVVAENCHRLRNPIVKSNSPRVLSLLNSSLSNGRVFSVRIRSFPVMDAMIENHHATSARQAQFSAGHGISSEVSLEILLVCGRRGLRGFQPCQSGDTACVRGPLTPYKYS